MASRAPLNQGRPFSPAGRPGPSPAQPQRGRGAEATTLQGAESSASGLTAPRGEPMYGNERRGRGRRYRPSEEAQLSRRIYRSYRPQHTDWAEEAAEDKEFYNGAHWTDAQREELLKRGQKPVAIQTVYQLVEQAISMLTSNDPSFRATARESSDASYAHMISNLMQWVWQLSGGNQIFKAVCRDYYVRGLGYMYAYVDPNKDWGKGDVCLTDLDPFTVLPDPNATDRLYDDAGHVLVRRIMTAEQVRARWPEAPLSQLQEYSGTKYNVGRSRQGPYKMDLLGQNTDQLHTQYEVIERFTKAERPHWRVRDPTTGQEMIFDKQEYRQWRERPAYLVQGPEGMRPVIDPETVQALDEIHDRVGEVYHLQRQEPAVQGAGEVVEPRPRPAPGPAENSPNAVPGSTKRLQPTTTGTLVDEGQVEARRFLLNRIKVVATIDDYELYDPIDLPIQHYPVVPFPNTHNRNPYPISDVRRVKHMQELINKTNSLILAHAANVTNQKVFYPRGGIQDPDHMEEQWSSAGSAFIPYDPAHGRRGGIEVAQPSQLPGELYQNQDRFIKLMERTLGLFPLQQGDASNAPDTYQGTLSIDEFGMRRIRSKMDDIEASMERIGRVTINLAQGLYGPEKVFRLTKPNGQTIEQKLGVPGPGQEDNQIDMRKFEDMMSTRYDMIIESGSTLPSNRWAMLQQYIEMFDRGVVDDIAVLKHSDIPDAESILERKSMYSEMQSAIQSQRQTIEDLQSEVQTAQRAAIRGEKKAELARFKAKLDELEGSLQRASERFEDSLQNEQEKQKAILQERRQRFEDNIEQNTQSGGQQQVQTAQQPRNRP